MKLEVVTIGTELLLGQTLDTNAAELGRALAAAGVEVVRHTSVADRPELIRAAVTEALDRTGFVITTGGLGPTRDDMTKREVAALFGKALQLDETVLRALEDRFRRLGRAMPAVNRTQAEVPAGATVLPNPRGTAPGLWVEDRGRVVVMLPGVPSEMRGLLAEEVLPRLAARGTGLVVRSRSVRTTGIAESALAERVGAIEEEIAPLTLAYLPSTDGVELRVTAWGLPADEADGRLAAAAAQLHERAGEHAYGEDGIDLAAVVLEQLRARKARLVVAESCTGGLLGGRITAVPGASSVFIGGVVAYDDVVKSGTLDVPPELLEQYGAVSEQVVSAMAEGVQRQFAVDAALAITGIAGPTGGTADKPVGTVWLAARMGARARALKRIFPGDRGEIRARSAQAALDLLRRRSARPTARRSFTMPTSLPAPPSRCCSSTTGIRNPPAPPTDSARWGRGCRTRGLPPTSWTSAGTVVPEVAAGISPASASCWATCKPSGARSGAGRTFRRFWSAMASARWSCSAISRRSRASRRPQPSSKTPGWRRARGPLSGNAWRRSWPTSGRRCRRDAAPRS